MAGAVYAGLLMPMFGAGYLLLSLVTFILYWHDKTAARRGRWRIRESTLHICSVLGGWPGGMAGQYLLRHKTQKTSFKRLFYLTVVTNIVIVTIILG